MKEQARQLEYHDSPEQISAAELQKYRQKRISLLQGLAVEQKIAVDEKLADFLRSLEDEYNRFLAGKNSDIRQNPNDSLLFHAMSGSTRKDNPEPFDFKPPWSMRDFIDNLFKQYHVTERQEQQR